VIDRQGWDNIQRALPRIQEIEGTFESVTNERDRLNLENASLRAQLRQLKALDH
jgi:regulator of replication initiation timing